MHRLSLNPLHHIDWLGLALMFTVGFGWAKPVPVNPNYFRKPKQGMAVTALAGPVSNLLWRSFFLGFAYVNTKQQEKYQQEMAAWQAYQDSVAARFASRGSRGGRRCGECGCRVR